MSAPYISSPPMGLAHPLQGYLKAVTVGGDHAGFNATLLPLENPQTLLLVWRSGMTHAAREGSELKLLVSHDEGASFEGLRSIYLAPEWDTRNFAGGVLGNGRVGLVAARFRGSGKHVEMATPVFNFSDDGGATWRSRETPLPATTPFASFHGDIMPWPTVAGGHDERGFAAFSYNFPRKTIDGLYTRDNGETWFWKTDICKSDGKIADNLTEVWVAALAPEGPWLMTARPTTAGSQRNIAVLTSKDLVIWEGPFDGGLLLSGNAPALLIENGEAYLYTVSRRGANRELPNAAGETLGNRLLVAHAPAQDIVAGKADFSVDGGWKEIATLPDHAVGYIFPRKVRRRWFAAFNCGETGSVGTSESKRSWLAIMTPHPPVIIDAPTLRSAIPLDNQLDNGDFSIWSRGDRFDRTAPGQLTADRWSVEHAPDDPVTVTKVAAEHPVGGPRTWLRKFCREPKATIAHKTVQRLANVATGADERLTLMLRARSSLGAWLAAIRLVQDFGVGGSPTVEITLQKNIRLTGEPLFYSFPTALPPVTRKIIGPGAALRLEIVEREAEDSQPFDITYGDVALVLSPTVTRVRPVSPDQNRIACARYFRCLDLAGLACGSGRIGHALLQATFDTMARVPILRLAADVENGDAGARTDHVAALEPGHLSLLRLTANDVRFLTGPHPIGDLVTSEFTLDAEWYGGDLSAANLERHAGSGNIIRCSAPTAWMGADCARAIGYDPDALPTVAKRDQTGGAKKPANKSTSQRKAAKPA
jgi:hypothetical protein